MAYKTFRLGDLRTVLAPRPNTRKQAVLDTHGTLDHTTILGWKEALRMPASKLAKDIIIRAQPRHLRLDYVFWEYHENGQAAPLFGLEDSVSEVTLGRSFADLQALYDRMIWIDMQVEAVSFVRDLNKALEAGQ